VQYINRFYRRTGSLWEGRYKSSVVQAETYLLACYRYIELNPVRADMVADPGQYQWSSYRANGLGQADARITPHALYLAQGRSNEERTSVYRSLFRPQLDAEAAADIRQALQLGMPVGNDRFADAICARAGIRRNSGKRGRPLAEIPGGQTRLDGQEDFGF
jgi:putative transposase